MTLSCSLCGQVGGLYLGDDTTCVECSGPCPLCREARHVVFPAHDDAQLYPCPLCRPWPSFPGYGMDGRWIVPPYLSPVPPRFYRRGTGPRMPRPREVPDY